MSQALRSHAKNAGLYEDRRSLCRVEGRKVKQGDLPSRTLLSPESQPRSKGTTWCRAQEGSGSLAQLPGPEQQEPLGTDASSFDI